ncbi:hypothetical protein NDU88_003259 [Pleurodeles waltl]|uniref:Uncharacterized protein n=1 Tax=Pleurodeles waltl TaxID=8319 RepID=A0AAV7TMX5_PLEWA|nr:hypothetical protein NDU88_003259 [Pleurodeles waltl]
MYSLPMELRERSHHRRCIVGCSRSGRACRPQCTQEDPSFGVGVSPAAQAGGGPRPLRARGAWWAWLQESPKGVSRIGAERALFTEQALGPSRDHALQSAHRPWQARNVHGSKRASSGARQNSLRGPPSGGASGDPPGGIGRRAGWEPVPEGEDRGEERRTRSRHRYQTSVGYVWARSVTVQDGRTGAEVTASGCQVRDHPLVDCCRWFLTSTLETVCSCMVEAGFAKLP